MDRIVLTKTEHKNRIYTTWILTDEKRRFQNLQVFEPQEQTILNNIYTAYVEKIVVGINAAFVRIANDQKCYLPLENLKSPVFTKKQSENKPICEGDELFVQVTREAVKTKDPVVSTALIFHGRHCLLSTADTTLGVSKKIPAKRKEELLALGSSLCPMHETEGYGILFRTSAKDASEEELKEDIHYVWQNFKDIMQKGQHEHYGRLIYRDLSGYILRLKAQDMANIEGIYTDAKDLYDETASYFPEWVQNGFLHFYDDSSVSLSILYHLKGNMDELLGKKVWLKSGANIIIEQLETLTVIDVNSGKNQSKKAEALAAVNKEAAVEIARQLRLRNISGMILIDFINMKQEEDTKDLIRLLRAELKKDAVTTNFIDITKLGLAEVTRKKVYKSLREIMG